MRVNRLSIICSIILISGIAGGTGTALAGGFTLHERSAAAQGASFAGADSGGDDITFAAFNPAALGNVEHFEVGANLSLIVFDTEAKAYNPFSATNSTASFGDPALVPALALGYRLSDKLVLGLTANAQFGLMTDYPNNALKWPAAGAALETSLTTFTVTPIVAWQPVPELTIAAGPAIHYADATLSRAIGTPGSLGSTYPAFPEGRLTGDTYELSWQAGVLFRPAAGTTIGLSFTKGYTLDFDGRFKSAAGAFDATAKARVPDVIGLGLRQELGGGLTLMADARYFTWSRFDVIKIGIDTGAGISDASEVTNYDDSVFLALGLEADVGNGLTLRGGVAYDQTPTSDAFRSPRVPDANRIWLSLGASYRPSDSLKLDVGYSLLLPEDSTVAANGVTVPTQVKYGGQIHIVSVGASLRF